MNRKKSKFYGLIILALLIFSLQGCISDPLKKGEKAPLFEISASFKGEEFTFSLKEKLEKGPVVVYFYPSAYTKGCDLEARTFAVMIEDFKAENTTILGVSADTIERLNAYSSDPDYCAGKFAVGSDVDGKIAEMYGLPISPKIPGIKDVNGEKIEHGFIPRTTFVINKKGVIEAVFSSKEDAISPDEHVKKALEIVQNL